MWNDLLVGLDQQADGRITFGSWAVRGPDLPAGVVVPYGITPDTDTEAELLRVEGVNADSDLESQLGPGWYSRGRMEWHVDVEAPDHPVAGVFVDVETCD